MRNALCCTLAVCITAAFAAAGDGPVAPGRLAGDDALAKEVDEILVTGRRLQDAVPVVPIDSVGSRDVFGPERVRETGARDINDLVQHIPAISTRPYNGGEAAAPNFSMRGLPDDGLTEYVNVMIDGVPASPMPYGWTAFSFLPVTPDRIYAIDYLRGAHSVRYSPNTVGGILNLLTTPIPDRSTLNLRTTYGDFDYLSTMISAGATTDAYGVGATFVDRRGDGYRRNGAFDQRDANAKFRWDIEEGRWVAVSASYMESGHQAPGGLTQAQFAMDRFGNARPLNRFDGRREVVDTVYHSDAVESGWWEGFFYTSHTKRHLRAQRPHFGTATDLLDWTDDTYFIGVGARIQRKIGEQHTVYGGVRFHTEWLDSWRITSEPFPSGARTLTRDSDYSLTTFSFHVDDTWRPNERLTVQFGARIEWVPQADGDDDILGFDFDDDFFDVLPGVGGAYEFSEHCAVFANYFMGFRAPQVWGFDATTANGALDFEEGDALEFGVRGRDWHGFSGSVTVWRTTYDNFGVFYTGFYENLGKIVAEGIDFEVVFEAGAVWESLQGFSIGGSITIQDSELRSGPNTGNETPYAWEQKAAWFLRYERGHWVAILSGTFVGESFSDDANTAAENPDGNLGLNPSRTLWDARVSRAFELGEQGRVELAIGATNLFDKEWFVHSRGGFFGGGKVAGPPRQGFVSIDFVFHW